jgi:two-component system, sensor histidine kinase and response regulator
MDDPAESGARNEYAKEGFRDDDTRDRRSVGTRAMSIMNATESRPPILVVEDENVVAIELVSSLEKLGYPIAGIATTGEEAVALTAAKEPGLVLMDIHLRGRMDGIQAAQQIQEKLFIPVVYLAGHSDEPTLSRARVTQPFGYVLKPFEDREIEVAIQIAIFRHQMERALRENEKRLDAILCSIDDAVIATDTHRRITFLNPAAESLLGWNSDRARGRLVSDVIKVASDGKPLQLFRRHGVVGAEPQDVVPVELLESPVLAAGGGEVPTGYVTVLRDISERLLAQEAHERELVERAARAAAEKEHERARLKSEISLALGDITQLADHTMALRKVANLVASSLGACCIVHVEDRAQGIRIAARSDRPPLDETPGGGSRGSAAGGTREENAGEPEELEPLPANPTSAIGVPLRARQRVIGSLTIFSTEPNRGYDPSDQTFVQEIADRVALAIDNGRLYLEVQEAKTAAERLYEAEQRARAEAQAMFRIAEALSEAQLDLDAVVQRVTNEATMLVGAKFGAFYYNLVDGHVGSAPYTLSGVSRTSFERLGLAQKSALLDATFIGQIVRLDDVEHDHRYASGSQERTRASIPLASYLAVPVVSRTGHVIGGLFFGHSEPAQFTEQHERMAKALATHAAIVIDNARLFKATREAEERQGRLVQELERAVRFSEMFVGILGHDLRNPLSGITTATSLAMSRADSERVATPLARVLSSAERMSRMIDQILDFTRIRLGRELPLQRTAVDFATVCRLVLDELEGAAESETELRLDVRGDVRGHWDADRLAQLVSNLAGNAVQHRQPGTPVAVTIDGGRPHDVRFEIQNVGVIPADILPTIFEPLRSGAARKREGASGLGLGLYISQEIAVAHGGSIHVVSDAKGGTRFKVDLPRRASDTDLGVFVHSVGPTRANMRQKRILIVEDDVDIRDTLRDAFEDEGYLVLSAGNGLEGLNTLRKLERPTVVVLDLMMPLMDGNELYEAMLADPNLSDIPVIVSTSDPSRAPSGVLLMKKPVNLRMMLKTVARFC